MCTWAGWHEVAASNTVHQALAPVAAASQDADCSCVFVQAHGELEAATRSVLRKHGLQLPDSFVHKAVQLHETLGVRFGVMVVGPTGTGKSTLLRTLQVTPLPPVLHLLSMRTCKVWRWQHRVADEYEACCHAFDAHVCLSTLCSYRVAAPGAITGKKLTSRKLSCMTLDFSGVTADAACKQDADST